METKTFKLAVGQVLGRTPLCERLLSASAVVLERIARGGGATRWYFCRDQKHLEKIEEQLSPGSVVSFFFDERIRRTAYSAESESRMKDLLEQTGEVFVGVLGNNGVQLDMELIVGPIELEEVTKAVPRDSEIFFGVFPAPDNDGINAITVTIPDLDGVVRNHPH